jgi:hypothetical protein
MSKSAANSLFLILQMPINMQFRFSVAILDFEFNCTVYKIGDTTVKKFDPENIGVTSGILFLSALELEIPLDLHNSRVKIHLQ